MAHLKGISASIPPETENLDGSLAEEIWTVTSATHLLSSQLVSLT